LEDRDSRLVRAAYEAWNAGGPSTLVQWSSEALELHDAPELPDAQTWRGRDTVLGRLEDVAATTGGRWADIDDVRAIGDEVLVTLTWRMDESSSAALADVYHVVRVDGGAMTRIRVFLDEAQAIRAAASPARGGG
jgi:hypothetical protein